MRRLVLATAFILCLGCGARADEQLLFDPAKMLGTAQRMDFKGQNAFTVENSEFGKVLRSIPMHSASGLYHSLDIGGAGLSKVAWRWRVDRLQPHADLRALATEDFGAAVFFIFGEPSLFNRDVPTIAYVWSATAVVDGTVMQSQRFRALRYVQLRGPADAAAWQLETRNVAADFQTLFGSAAPRLKKIAVFNDNDDTGEPASAVFGPIVCKSACP